MKDEMEIENNIEEKSENKTETKPEETKENKIEEKFKDKEESIETIVKNNHQEETIVNLNIPSKKIGIASDHRGYDLKQKLTKYLIKKGYTVIDYGCDDKNSHDYPEYGFKLGEAIRDGKVEKGIAICGSGIGISIACNKVKGVRCAKVDTPKEAKYTRRDNDANVIAISSSLLTYMAKDILDAFLNTNFTGETRHQRRIDMLNNY